MHRQGIDDEYMEEIIEKLVKNGLVDDRKFALAFTKDKMKFSTMGPYKIEMELKKHKIDDKIIYESIHSITYEEIVEKIAKENWFDYDVIVATPEMMVQLGKLGKVLGPKGLMPNPKTGTVTTNVEAAIENIKKGMIEYRADSNGNVHAIVGKVSFDEDKLVENLVSFVNEVIKNKPSGVKGTFVKNITISSTMGPGVKLDLSSF